jgi:hypothetical protein
VNGSGALVPALLTRTSIRIEPADPGGDIAEIADIADQRAGCPAFGGDFRGHGFKVRQRPADQDDLRAGPAKGAGTGPAEAASRAGDDGDFSVEAHLRRSERRVRSAGQRSCSSGLLHRRRGRFQCARIAVRLTHQIDTAGQPSARLSLLLIGR